MKPIDDETMKAVDDTCRFICRFGMTVPALLAIESMRPLSFVGSQLMHMLTPSIAAFLSPTKWDSMAKLLESREGLDYFLERLEAIDKEKQGSTSSDATAP